MKKKLTLIVGKIATISPLSQDYLENSVGPGRVLIG